MKYKLNIFLLFIRSLITRKNLEFRKMSEIEFELARGAAKSILDKEIEIIESSGYKKILHTKFFLSIELQFLWGVFHEVVTKESRLPTNGFDRINIHIISWLTERHGYSLQMARDEALALEALYNEEDPLFDAISDVGKKAFHDRYPGRLIDILKTVADNLQNDPQIIKL